MTNVPGWRAWCLLAAVAVTGGACGKRAGGSSRGVQASPSTPAVLHGGAGLPAVCDQYRRKLLQCMQSAHFPAAAKPGQQLALEQMLAVVTEEQHKDGDATDMAAAIQNCQDSLNTLYESGKVTCPEAL